MKCMICYDDIGHGESVIRMKECEFTWVDQMDMSIPLPSNSDHTYYHEECFSRNESVAEEISGPGSVVVTPHTPCSCAMCGEEFNLNDELRTFTGGEWQSGRFVETIPSRGQAAEFTLCESCAMTVTMTDDEREELIASILEDDDND